MCINNSKAIKAGKPSTYIAGNELFAWIGEVFSSWAIARSSSFWRFSSLSCSFKSSRSFVLFSLSLLSFFLFLFQRALHVLCPTFFVPFLCFLLSFQARQFLFSCFQDLFPNSFLAALTFEFLLHFQVIVIK